MGRSAAPLQPVAGWTAMSWMFSLPRHGFRTLRNLPDKPGQGAVRRYRPAIAEAAGLVPQGYLLCGADPFQTLWRARAL